MFLRPIGALLTVIAMLLSTGCCCHHGCNDRCARPACCPSPCGPGPGTLPATSARVVVPAYP
jgi:hypothetical protein